MFHGVRKDLAIAKVVMEIVGLRNSYLDPFGHGLCEQLEGVHLCVWQQSRQGVRCAAQQQQQHRVSRRETFEAPRMRGRGGLENAEPDWRPS